MGINNNRQKESVLLTSSPYDEKSLVIEIERIGKRYRKEK